MRISKNDSKIILGIDPGLATTGWGIVKAKGQNLEAMCWGIIETKKTTDFPKRLNTISQDLNKLIKKYKPNLAVVEKIFFCKNVKTALLVGQARGVIISELSHNKIPILEFTPLQVKQSTVGYGQATKNQVQKMVKIILNLDSLPKPDDAADALALATMGSHSKKYMIK